MEHSEDVERGLLLEDNAPPTSTLLETPANDGNDYDFSFAAEGNFLPSQLTLANAQRASSMLNNGQQNHPKSSNFFEDL